jgi:hypothetical protein
MYICAAGLQFIEYTYLYMGLNFKMAFSKGMFFETYYCRGDPHSPFISNSQKIHMYKGEKQKTNLQTTTDCQSMMTKWAQYIFSPYI